jgi:hypothetical protein
MVQARQVGSRIRGRFRFSPLHPADVNWKSEAQIRNSHIGKRRAGREPGARTCRTWFSLFRSSHVRFKEPPPHILISFSPLSSTRLMNETIPGKRA